MVAAAIDHRRLPHHRRHGHDYNHRRHLQYRHLRPHRRRAQPLLQNIIIGPSPRSGQTPVA